MTAFDAVAWNAEHGRPGFAAKIHELQCTRSEVHAEAGPNGQFCQFTQEALAKLDAEIEEIRRCAQDRFDDLASD